MASFKEIIYNFKNLKQAGRQSQDSLLSDSQTAFIINYYREVLISRDYNKRKLIAPILEENVECKVQRVKSMETMFDDRQVYKLIDVPQVVQTDVRPLFNGIRYNLLDSTITRTTSNQVRHQLKDRMTGHLPRYFPLGEEVYIVTPDPLQKVFVTGVFSDPTKVQEINGKLNPFDPYNYSYPMPNKMIEIINKMMVDGEINLSVLSSDDQQNDGIQDQMRQTSRRRPQQQEE